MNPIGALYLKEMNYRDKKINHSDFKKYLNVMQSRMEFIFNNLVQNMTKGLMPSKFNPFNPKNIFDEIFIGRDL